MFLVLPSDQNYVNNTNDLIDQFWKLESICVNSSSLNEKNGFLIKKKLPSCEEEAHWSSFYSDNNSNIYL
jgi:hypothetical protein